MRFDDYIEHMNRRQRGPLGPIGSVQVYRIDPSPRPGPRAADSHSAEARPRQQLARHAAAAERDAAGMERARFLERLDRHAADAEHDRLVARLRRLR